MSNISNNQSPIEITNYPIESSSTNNPPSNSEGFLFLELPDLNSLLYLGGSTPDSFGLYLFDINNSTWVKSSLKGDFLPPMNYFSGWYDSPFLFIHGGKSLQKGENKSFKETYLIDISTMTIHKLFTIEEPSSRYGHMAIKNNDKQAYIFGGCNIGKKSERYLNDLHKMEYKNISVITGDNANVNGASWIVNIQTKGEKPPGRKGYTMMYAESINSLIIYGGELKDKKINDDGIYLYNVDDKEYKKINLKGSDLLGFRAYHSMQLNDTNNKIYIIGGIDNNKNVLNDIIEIEVKDKSNIDVKKYEGNDILGKRYNHKGCNIFFRGDNENELLYHILILGGKKSEIEFYDNSLIDIFIKDENMSNNNDEIKEEEIEENMNKVINNKENNLYDNDDGGDIGNNEIENNINNLPLKLPNDFNQENKGVIPLSNSNSNRTIYSNHNNNYNINEKINQNINEYHININKKLKLDNLIKLQKEYIEKYKKYQKINEEYYSNRNKLNELNIKELTKKILEQKVKNKTDEKSMKLDKIKGEIFTLQKKLKESKNYNELITQYMNLYKQRYCYLSDFLSNYIEDITKLDNLLMEYGQNIQGLNYEVFWNKRKKYQMEVINLFKDIKKYNFFEKNLWDEIKNKKNYSETFNENNSYRNTVQKVNKKEETVNMNEI